MASFELRSEEGIIYNIKVGEFVFRNTFGKDSMGNITSLEATGYTSITSVGDDVVAKLGREAIESREKFFFVNHPDYYLQLDSLSKLGSITRTKDPTDNNDVSSWIYDYYYGYINVYKNNTSVRGFIPYYKIIKKDSLILNDEGKLTDTLPNFTLTNFPFWHTRIAFNFTQQAVAYVSPFKYVIQSFINNRNFSPNTNQVFYGNNTPQYIGQSFTLKNKNVNLSQSGLYDYNTGNDLIYANIKNYSDLSGKELIASVAGNAINSGISNTITFSMTFQNSNVEGKNNYDWWYWLLNETDSEDDPYPDKDPNKDPSGQSKPTTGGNPSGGNPDSDNIGIPLFPSVNPINTGSVNLYEMSASTFRDFMSYLWNDTFFNTIIKLFQNPMEAVISAHIIGIAVPTSGRQNIVVGNVQTTVQANVVSNNFVSANFNYIHIPEFYKDASDYLETVIELYLPYHGYVTLNTLEVMGADVYLQYMIDVLTGTFVAFVRVVKTIDGTQLDSVLYQFNGNMAYQIPLSSVDYSSFITSAIGAVGALTQKRIGSMAAGIVDSALSIDIGYDRASSLSSNTGYMSVKQAYVTILRPIHSLAPNFAHYVGYPYEGYVNLGSCSGLTICREVYILNVIGSQEETEEIKNLLKEGVIF